MHTLRRRRINHRFKIPFWNLRREQQISRHVSAWYPIFPISQTAGRACRESPWISPWISPHLPHPPGGASSSADSLITR